MGKDSEVQLTLRVPKDIHTKVKILGAIHGQSMADVIVDLIRKAVLKVPDFIDTETVKTLKAIKRKKPSKLIISDKEQKKLKSQILKLSHDGASLGQIAKQLTEEGTPTVTGGKVWHRGTLGHMLDRWKKEGKIKSD